MIATHSYVIRDLYHTHVGEQIRKTFLPRLRRTSSKYAAAAAAAQSLPSMEREIGHFGSRPESGMAVRTQVERARTWVMNLVVVLSLPSSFLLVFVCPLFIQYSYLNF